MKALDFVRTPKGGLAVISEVGEDGQASITYLKDCNPGREHNAWWSARQLTVIDSIPSLLANMAAHPFGRNTNQGDRDFPIAN
jgi:hypothetical protein